MTFSREVSFIASSSSTTFLTRERPKAEATTKLSYRKAICARREVWVLRRWTSGKDFRLWWRRGSCGTVKEVKMVNRIGITVTEVRLSFSLIVILSNLDSIVDSMTFTFELSLEIKNQKPSCAWIFWDLNQKSGNFIKIGLLSRTTNIVSQ